jgi:hypothetical protein
MFHSFLFLGLVERVILIQMETKPGGQIPGLKGFLPELNYPGYSDWGPTHSPAGISRTFPYVTSAIYHILMYSEFLCNKRKGLLYISILTSQINTQPAYK